MNLWNKIKSGSTALLIGGAALFGLNSDKNSPPKQEKPVPKVIIDKPTVKNPSVQITYQTDTLKKHSSILLYNLNNHIYRHYRKGDSSYRMRMHLFVHENWHSHNNNLNFRMKIFSPYEYRKLCIHDEISACLCSLNSLIIEYNLTDKKEEFLKYFANPNNLFSFYFKEVANGNIDPFSTNPSMIEKDRKLRVNGMINNWMRRIYKGYAGSQQRMLLNYTKRIGIHKSQDKAYKKALNHMYSMGGINFWKYVDKDIKVNDNSILNSLNKIKSLPNSGKNLVSDIQRYFPLVEKIQDDTQRHIALQHLLISAEIKTEMAKSKNNNYIDNKQIATILYNKIKTRYSLDKSFTEFTETGCLSTKKTIYDVNDNESLDDFVNKVYYTKKWGNLKDMINDFEAKDVPCKLHMSIEDYMDNFNETIPHSYNEALNEYQKAQMLNPDNINTVINIGTLYQEQKK